MVESRHHMECVQGGALFWAGTTGSIGAATVSGENNVRVLRGRCHRGEGIVSPGTVLAG